MTLTGKGVNGQLEVDDQWVTIERKGAMAKMTQGLKGSKRIPIANITSVQFKKAGAMTSGYIQFSMMGSSESKGGLLNAQRDENSVSFNSRHAKEFEAIRDRIESVIATGQRTSAPAPAGGGLADELKKLAELRDSGVLSEEEFATQKAKLLG
jgi:hypothetical protein